MPVEEVAPRLLGDHGLHQAGDLDLRGWHVPGDLDQADGVLGEHEHERGLREGHGPQQRLDVEAVGDHDDRGQPVRQAEAAQAGRRREHGQAVGEQREGHEVLGEVVASKPDFLQAVQNYSLALAGIKKYDEALNILNDGIRMAPRYAGFYRARGMVYKIQGNAALSRADEIRAAQLESGQR